MHNVLPSSRVATAERVSCEPSDNFVYQRSRLAYHYAAGLIDGRVLEIGTGTGYGVEILSPKCSKFTTLDKCPPSIDSDNTLPDNVEMITATVPPLPFPDSSFDCVVSFQVIEHIEHDTELVAEVYRVLKPDGLFIVSTPNAPMSLTRNPWHIREYRAEEFLSLLSTKFSPLRIKKMGVEGNERVMEYYEKNRQSVEKITKYDIFDLQHRLPRWMLQIPYDILNRINRRRLLAQNSELTQSIKMEDYKVAELSKWTLDLLYIAQK